MATRDNRFFRDMLVVMVVVVLTGQVGFGQQAALQPAGSYAGLDARRKGLVDNWVARFVNTTGQRIEAGPFYDDVLSVSAKTTFEAITHALMATTLTSRGA